MNILIIEDEELAYKNLVKLLHEYDRTIRISGWTTTVRSSIEWLANNSGPDLIFADIHLPDASAFEIFKKTEINIPVIFTTAYDKYAIEAFEVNCVDYLLKPIKIDRLSRSIDKYKLTRGNGLNQSLIVQLQQQINQLSNASKEFKHRFLIKSGNKFNYIETKDIAYFFADGNIVFAVTKDNKKSIIDYSLESLEKKLDPNEFFRVTRKYIIHISSIRNVSKYFHSRLKIMIHPDPKEDILISRIKVPIFLDWMEGID
jgi:two-component system response regulator LytT